MERFRRLYHSSYLFNAEESSYLNGVEAHFHKLMLWRNLAEEHLPKLEEDIRIA